MIPYMRAQPRAQAAGPRRADAVIAVSTTIAADLRARAPELAATRLEIIPNPVDIAAPARDGPRRRRRRSTGPYALYLGKLAPNKGTSHLVDVVERAGLDWPLVIAGDGPDRDAHRSAARHAPSRDIRLIGWVDQAQATAWLAHASMLIFPSRGPESLSRVLIEASALGVPIAAMNTGGTPDIVEHGETGLLSATPEALADDVRRLRRGRGAARDGSAPRRASDAEPRSTPPAVVARIERALPRAAKGRRPMTSPLRVAVVARSVFPLHGSAASSATSTTWRAISRRTTSTSR